MAQAATAEILLRLNTREYDQQLSQVQRDFTSFSGSQYDLNLNTRNADSALQTTLGIINRITGTLKGFGQQAIGEFQAFSGALSGAQAISGATSEELDKLKESAIELGIATTKSPTQVAEAATAYARLGKSIGQAVEDLPGLVQLSESTGSSLETSAGVTATATKIFGDSINALKAANIITAATTNTAVSSVDEFNQILSKAGGLAKANGVSFEELAATFGLLRDTGSSTEVAATAVKNVLTNLVVPTEEGKKAIASLGLQIRNEQGKFVGLRAVLEQLKVSLAGVSDEARDKALKDIFGRSAGPAITSLLALDDASFQRVFDNIQSSSEGAGVAANTANTRLQGLNKTLTLLTGTTQTVRAAVGEQLAPALNLSASATLTALNTFLELDPAIQGIIVKTGALVAGLGSLIVSLSTLRSIEAAGYLDKIGLSATALKGTFDGLVDRVGKIAGAQVALPNVKFDASGLTPTGILTAKEAQAQEALTAAERTKKTKEAIQKEAEFVAFKKQLAAEEAALNAQKITGDNKAALSAAARAKTEAARAKITAQAAAADTLAATQSQVKAKAELAAAQAAVSNATAETKGIKATVAKTAATLKSAIATDLSATKTKYGAAIKNVYAVATGKASAAEFGFATSLAASALQLGLFAAAAFVVVDALKSIGIVGNTAQKSLDDFKEGLIEIGEAASTGEESPLGALDAIKTGLVELYNFKPLRGAVLPFSGFFLPDLNPEDFTSDAIKNQQLLIASAEASEILGEKIDLGNAVLRERGRLLKDEAKVQELSTGQKATLISGLEEELEAKKALIAEAQKSGLQVQGDIATLQTQSRILESYIAQLRGDAVPATAEQQVANELVTKSLDELTEAQKRARAEGELAIAQTKALLAEKQLAGEVSEEDAQKEIFQAEQELLRQRLDQNREFLAELEAQKEEASSALSEKDAIELDKKITEAQKEEYDTRLTLARNELQEQKRISDERLADIKDANEERLGEIDRSILEAKSLFLQEQLDGVSTARETQEKIAQAELEGIQKRIDSRREALAELRLSEDISPEALKAEEQKALDDILRLEIEQQQKRLQARQQANDARINEVKEQQDQEQKALDQGLKDQELILKRSLLNREITEAEYQKAIKEGQKKASEEKIKSLEREADRVVELANQSVIPQAEAEKRLGEIRNEITQEQIGLLDDEISLQKEAANVVKERFEKEIESRKLANDLTVAQLETEKEALESAARLGEAQQALGDAQIALTAQRLKFAQEDDVYRDRSFETAKAIFALEKKNTLDKLENERRLLEIKIQQQKIDGLINESNAEIAVVEAKAAIEAAKARNASQEELDNLQKVLELKNIILNRTQASTASQAKLLDIEKDTLALNQERTQEELARQQELLNLQQLSAEVLTDKDRAALEQERAKEEEDSARIIGELQTKEFRSTGEKAGAIAAAALGNIENEALLRDIGRAGGFAGEIGGLVGQLQTAGISAEEAKGFTSEIKGAETSQEVIDLLKQLIQTVQDSNRPNISVNSENPIDDVLTIMRG